MINTAIVMHSSHYNHRLVCMITVLGNGIPFVSLQNVCSSTTFQRQNYLSIVGLSGKKIMQLHVVSGKVEFNACQVSLLWQNSFMPSSHLARTLCDKFVYDFPCDFLAS